MTTNEILNDVDKATTAIENEERYTYVDNKSDNLEYRELRQEKTAERCWKSYRTTQYRS